MTDEEYGPFADVLYVIVGREGGLGGWHHVQCLHSDKRVECLHVFMTEADAWAYLLDKYDSVSAEVAAAYERAMRHEWRVVPVACAGNVHDKSTGEGYEP